MPQRTACIAAAHPDSVAPTMRRSTERFSVAATGEKQTTKRRSGEKNHRNRFMPPTLTETAARPQPLKHRNRRVESSRFETEDSAVSVLDKIFSRLEEEVPENAGHIRLVVGLGNPGPEYDKTRHNIGFELVDRMVRERGWKWARERKFRARIARETAALIFAKPLTYMNLSGNAVARLMRFFQLEPDQILVVYDDVDLPVGRLRFRAGGSAGGHNGIKSLIEYLGTNEFPRLKIGIGAAGGREEMIDHVLGKFGEEESAELEKVLAIAQDGVNCALSAGLDRAMNQFNGRGENPEKGS